MAKILLIDDDQRLCLNIADFFEHKNFSVETVHDGYEATALLQCSNFDLIILDVNLPGMTGYEICKHYRSSGGKTPILFLTGQDKLIDKEMGFGSGADDYLTKPFYLEELFLRVQAVLRRSSKTTEDVLRSGALKLDPIAYTVERGEEKLSFSKMEFALLEFLMRNPKKVFSPEALLSHVWESGSEASPETVRTWVKRLRRKLDEQGKPSVIKNFHGIGYCFDAVG